MQHRHHIQPHTHTSGCVQEKLPHREEPPHDNMYQASCPTCRAACPLSSIPHLVPTLEKALQRGVHLANTATNTSGQVGDPGLDMSRHAQIDASTLASMQVRHKRMFEKQQRAGGIIDPNAAVPMSITELEAIGRSASQVERSASASQDSSQTSLTAQATQQQHTRQQQRAPTTLKINSKGSQYMGGHSQPGRGRGGDRADRGDRGDKNPGRDSGRGRHSNTSSQKEAQLCDGIAALQMSGGNVIKQQGVDGSQVRSSGRGRGRGHESTRSAQTRK